MNRSAREIRKKYKSFFLTLNHLSVKYPCVKSIFLFTVKEKHAKYDKSGSFWDMWYSSPLRTIATLNFRKQMAVLQNLQNQWWLNCGKIGDFHVTLYQANFASRHTRKCHVGFLFTCDGIGKSKTKIT